MEFIKKNDNSFTLSIRNTGEGVNYHQKGFYGSIELFSIEQSWTFTDRNELYAILFDLFALILPENANFYDSNDLKFLFFRFFIGAVYWTPPAQRWAPMVGAVVTDGQPAWYP